MSPTEIYAVIGTKICMWNGSEWVDHTLDVRLLARAMHFVSPTQIYAVVGNQICMWDGLTWAPRSEKVCMWTGTGWVDITEDMTGLHPAFHYQSDENITAIAGLSLSQWALSDGL